MTLDRSLKEASGMARNRSVLNRAERIAQLTDEGKFDPEKGCVFGLPKVKVKHSKAGGKAKKAAEEGAEGEAAAPAAGKAAAGKAPAGGKAPAAGKAPAGKAAAPAAKAPAAKKK